MRKKEQPAGAPGISIDINDDDGTRYFWYFVANYFTTAVFLTGTDENGPCVRRRRPSAKNRSRRPIRGAPRAHYPVANTRRYRRSRASAFVRDGHAVVTTIRTWRPAITGLSPSRCPFCCWPAKRRRRPPPPLPRPSRARVTGRSTTSGHISTTPATCWNNRRTVSVFTRYRFLFSVYAARPLPPRPAVIDSAARHRTQQQQQRRTSVANLSRRRRGGYNALFRRATVYCPFPVPPGVNVPVPRLPSIAHAVRIDPLANNPRYTRICKLSE